MAGESTLNVVVKYDRLQKALTRMIAATSPVGQATFMSSVVHPFLAGRAEARFKKQGDAAAGGRWAPLADSTNEFRASLGFPTAPPGQINVRTGQMRDYLVSTLPYVTADPFGTVLSFPGPVPGALMDRFAQAAGSRKGPPRPVAAVDAKDLAFVLASMSAFVQGKKTRNGPQ